MTNSRNKGASFEREIANELTTKLELKHQLKRILEQTREKHLPDLISEDGTWNAKDTVLAMSQWILGGSK